jgi:hypothetical protein
MEMPRLVTEKVMAVKPNIDNFYRAESGAPVYNKKPAYNKDSVNKSIESSTRSGKKIGSSEGKAIHSLLKGRYAYGGPIKLKDCKVNTVEKNPKHKKF